MASIPKLCGALHRPRFVGVVVVTVRVIAPFKPPEVAEMVVVPAATATTKPLVLTVATAGSDELQDAVEVTVLMVASPYSAVALNCSSFPASKVQLVEGV